MPTTFNPPPLYLSQALSHARRGELVSLFGIEVPLPVLERCFRLVTRFGRDPLDYITRWQRFNWEKQRANQA